METRILNVMKTKNGFEIETVRKDFKKRSEVKIRHGNFVYMTYRFDNLTNVYTSPYISWANLNCCGGWVYDNDYLKYAVQNNKKLFAQLACLKENEIKELKETIDKDKFDYSYEIEGRFSQFYIYRKGTVGDYIDIGEVLDTYNKYGVYLDDEDEVIISILSETEMKYLINPNKNRYNYDFANPKYIGELIFTGLLLGYPIESTVSLIQR